MSEMVERGVRALAHVREQNGGPPYEGYDVIYGEKGARRLREQLAEEVRAVIEAMREPTEAMIAKGREETCEHGNIQCGCDESWRAMVDEALK